MKEWKTVKLGDVVQLINGRAYKKNELLNKGETPVLRVGNFFSNNNWYYSNLELEADKYCNKGDLLYAWSASFGPKIWDGPKVIYHYHIWKIKLTDKINKNFLYYLLQRKTNEIKSQGHGITMIHATKSGMENLNILLPPISIQKQIVSILEKAESLKQKREGTNKETQKIIQSIFYDMFGDPVKNEKGWDVKTIDQAPIKIIDGDRGNNYPNKNDFLDEEYCLFLNTKNVTKGGFNFKNLVFINKKKDEKLRKGKLQKYDLIITTRGTVGNIAIYNDSVQFHNIRINSGMVIIRPNLGNFNLNFLYVLFNSLFVQNQIKNITSGAAQPQLPIQNLKKINIFVPPLNLQEEFAKRVQLIESIQSEQQFSTEEINTLFDALMQKAFKGELV